MDQATLSALKGSIQKWRRIIEEGAPNHGSRDCPLCKLYNNWHSVTPCAGCPVAEHTEQSGCGGTPYEMLEECEDPINEDPEALEHAKAELAFLESLLPTQEGP